VSSILDLRGDKRRGSRESYLEQLTPKRTKRVYSQVDADIEPELRRKKTPDGLCILYGTTDGSIL